MKTLKTMKNLSLLLVVVVLLFSCSNDDDNNDNPVPQELNIVETAQATTELSILVDAVIQAGLVDALTASGNKTVLAPTNAAFTAFLAEKGFNPLSDVPNDVLTQILLKHVIAGTNITSSTLSGTTGYTSTLADGPNSAKLSIYFDGTSGVTFNGVASVAIPDVETSNGIVHVIDAVIDLPNVVTFATVDPNFSTLVTALTELTPATDFVGVLTGEGPFTVLAPTNDAFAALTAIPEESALTQILLNHVIGGPALSTDLVALNDSGDFYTNTLATGPGDNNLSLYFDTSDGVTFNGISSVVEANVVATNGIIHAIDAVITLPTIVDFALADPNFSTLVTALTSLTPETNFVEVLTGEGPFTVFAPTNDAFALVNPIPDEGPLTSILLHHVTDAGNIVSGDLQAGANVASTLQGQNITISLPGSGDNIANVTDGSGNTDAGIIGVDVQAANGVIHVLNKVLVPAL